MYLCIYICIYIYIHTYIYIYIQIYIYICTHAHISKFGFKNFWNRRCGKLTKQMQGGCYSVKSARRYQVCTCACACVCIPSVTYARGYNICVCARVRTEWWRCIGCLKLQVFLRKTDTNYSVVLRKIIYNDKASYASSPPCIYSETSARRYEIRVCACVCMCVHVYVCILSHLHAGTNSISVRVCVERRCVCRCICKWWVHAGVYVSGGCM